MGIDVKNWRHEFQKFEFIFLCMVVEFLNLLFTLCEFLALIKKRAVTRWRLCAKKNVNSTIEKDLHFVPSHFSFAINTGYLTSSFWIN